MRGRWNTRVHRMTRPAGAGRESPASLTRITYFAKRLNERKPDIQEYTAKYTVIYSGINDYFLHKYGAKMLIQRSS